MLGIIKDYSQFYAPLLIMGFPLLFVCLSMLYYYGNVKNGNYPRIKCCFPSVDPVLLGFAEDTSTLIWYTHNSGTNDFYITGNFTTNGDNSRIMPKTYSAVTFVFYNDFAANGLSGEDEAYIFYPIFLPYYDSTITSDMTPLYYSNFNVVYTDPTLYFYFDIKYASLEDRGKFTYDSQLSMKEFYTAFLIPATDLDNPNRETGYFLESSSNDSFLDLNIDAQTNGTIDSITVEIDLSNLSYYSRIYYDEATKTFVPIRYDNGGDISTDGSGIYANDVLHYTETYINTLVLFKNVSDESGNVDESAGYYSVTVMSEEEYYASIAAFTNPESPADENTKLWIIVGTISGLILISILGVGIYIKLVAPKDDFFDINKKKKKDTVEENPDLILGKKT